MPQPPPGRMFYESISSCRGFVNAPSKSNKSRLSVHRERHGDGCGGVSLKGGLFVFKAEERGAGRGRRLLALLHLHDAVRTLRSGEGHLVVKVHLLQAEAGAVFVEMVLGPGLGVEGSAHKELLCGGRGRTGLDPPAVAKDLEVAIRQFEPRLRADTVKVRPAPQAAAGHAIAFDIEAELWAEPVPLRLLLRTLIDLEDGAASLRPAENG